MSRKPPSDSDLSPRRPRGEPYLSRAPWHGFSAHDMPRAEPLPVCPSARCRRLCRCVDAIDGLYCRRTHLSLAEQAEAKPARPLQRLLARVPEAFPPGDLAARLERIEELASIRRDYDADMRARWRAGAFDHLYGRYRRDGALMRPPPLAYVDLRGKGPR
jgi:hypothetical protein